MSWLAPLLGLCGVMITAGLGYLQWRRTVRRQRSTTLQQRRAATLEELSKKLRQLEIHSRRGTITNEELQAQIRPLNEYVIESRSVLGSEDVGAARDFLDALIAIHREILEAPADARFEWANTGPVTSEDGRMSLLQYWLAKLARAESRLVMSQQKAWEGS